MPGYVQLFLSALMGFFAIMNPIGNTPIFLGLAGDFTESVQKRVARKSLVIAFFVVAVFVLSGNLIFKLFGISLTAFKLAGGVLLFLIGYQFLHGRESHIHHPEADNEDEIQHADDIAVSPLAVPIFAGPGTITTALNSLDSEAGLIGMGIVLLAFLLICIISYLFFISGEKIVKRVNPGIIRMITRLMGLILTVMAAQMIVSGTRSVFNL